MSFERDVNIAVQTMFKHTKFVIERNLLAAVKTGAITLDETKIPGLKLLINRAIDEAYSQSARELNSVLAQQDK